jgi:protein TonB
MVRLLTAITLATFLVACSPGGDSSGQGGGGGKHGPLDIFNRRPDTPPVMLNKDQPFQYPVALYPKKVQGNVVLRLFITKEGTVVQDSTRIAKGSGVPELDSAAMKGAKDLMFVPAKRRGEPLAVSILLTVYFRHPEAPPMPDDTGSIRLDTSRH